MANRLPKSLRGELPAYRLGTTAAIGVVMLAFMPTRRSDDPVEAQAILATKGCART